MSVAMDITSILLDQNPWWTDPNHREVLRFPHKRTIFARISDYLGDVRDDRALALLGPRQVGKTTLMRQLIDELLGKGWPVGNITFFDFSDERVVDAISPREIVDVRPQGLSTEQPRIFLFDEIQNVTGWQKWLKSAVDQARRHERPRPRFVVTGSAAASLRDGTVESGQGRWDELPIEGLTFSEFLAFRAPVGEDVQVSSARDPLALERYLSVGGFPEHSRAVSLRDARHRIRDDIADRAISRDLRHAGVDVDRVRRLFVYLVTGSGNIWNQQDRANDLDANRKSMTDWLTLLEDTRLVVRLDRERTLSGKASTQLRVQPKIYASDHGLVTAFSSHPEPLEDSDVRARVFETVVFRHLREVARDSHATLSYVRQSDELEIDFVLRHEKRTIGIEVTSSHEVKARKLARTSDVMRKLDISQHLIIHGGLVSTRIQDVTVVPLRDFLVNPGAYVGDDA